MTDKYLESVPDYTALLIRVDERTANMAKCLQEQKQSFDNLEELVVGNSKILAVHENALFGNEGQGGLKEEVSCLVKKQARLEKLFWSVVFFMIGSGVLGAGIWGIVTNLPVA